MSDHPLFLDIFSQGPPQLRTGLGFLFSFKVSLEKHPSVHTGIVTFSSILSICSSSEVTHCFKGIKINVCMYCTTVVHDALQIFKSTVFTDGQNFRGILNYFSSPLQSKAKFISASYISNLASVIVHVFMKGSSTLLWVTSKHSCEITRFFHRRT